MKNYKINLMVIFFFIKKKLKKINLGAKKS